jgi:hypothetical protein
MDNKTRILAGAMVTLYAATHVVADQNIPRNTKPLTFLVTVTSSTSATFAGGMPNMMSSEEKGFSTQPVELRNKLADKA